jgi:hypothetical protein
MDINLKAMSRALEKAGVSKEAQGDIIREVEKELREEHEKRARAEQEALRLAAEQSERERIEAELSSKPSLSSDEAPAVEIPEGATVFEG